MEIQVPNKKISREAERLDREKAKLDAATINMQVDNMHGFAVAVNTESEDLPTRKILREQEAKFRTDKAALRQEHCWMPNCDESCTTHVWRVGFDRGFDEAPYDEKSGVDSSKYPGAVPGFCWKHLWQGPPEIATVIYYDMEAMFWGYRPNRWFVFFTDGSYRKGSCIEINESPNVMPKTNDQHLIGERNG